MANPATVSCDADVWTKVATAVKSGQVSIKNNAPRVYRCTYVVTADPAPSDDSVALAFDEDGSLPISADEEIDVYIKPVGANGLVIVEI